MKFVIPLMLFMLSTCATAPATATVTAADLPRDGNEARFRWEHNGEAMGGPRGVQSCDRQGNCRWCEYVGNGTWDCR